MEELAQGEATGKKKQENQKKGKKSKKSSEEEEDEEDAKAKIGPNELTHKFKAYYDEFA